MDISSGRRAAATSQPSAGWPRVASTWTRRLSPNAHSSFQTSTTPVGLRCSTPWGSSTATPLFIAASNNDRTTVKLLLDAGADVDWTVRAASQAEPGGPLWHVIEHMVERVQGVQSSKEALELVRATAGQPRP
jgi:hypothetical protein